MDLASLTAGLEWGQGLEQDLTALLRKHQRLSTLAHVQRVAEEAKRLALRFGEDAQAAHGAGLLHDVSAVIPKDLRLEAARQWGVDILAEEESQPVLLHQNLSRVMARELFSITDERILSAIGCHTTLRPGAGRMDMLLFVADKIAWDQPGQPPYLPELAKGLERSLEQAALAYLEYLEASLGRPLHPWAQGALIDLRATRGEFPGG